VIASGELSSKTIAVYARFSSASQREASIDDQVRRCRDFIEARGGKLATGMIFADAAISGASLMRPAFERMMAAVDKKTIDVIVTEDLSRISRDLADSATLFKRLQYLGVELRGIADGINTSERSAKLTYTVKSLVSDLYLDDLRDKTLRGLEGRALAGFSTGGLALGYRSSPVNDDYGRVLGHRTEIDPGGRAVVHRIFALYRDGLSHRGIAALYNAEGVPPPRANSRHRRKGWVASTIREMLRNATYVGEWSFKKRQWRKLPGTNTRRYRDRPEADVIRQLRPELAIIERALWDEVRARAEAVRATYTQTSAGAPKGRASGRKNNYVLSGLLICGECGAAMTISRGTSAHYYGCGDHKKRGTCANKRSLREDVARRRLLEALAFRYRTPAAIAFLRQAIVDQLASMSRVGSNELGERRGRLARTEERIAKLIAFIARGENFDSVREALLDLEAQATQEKAAIAQLVAMTAKPVQLPSPDAILDQWTRLEQIVEHDPVRAREALRTLFAGKQLAVRPHADGRYMAEGQFDPLGLFRLDLSSPGDKTPKAPVTQGLRALLESFSSGGCAGRI